MSSLQFSERNLLEKILGMKTGYVSDFSDRTLQEFVLEKTGIDTFTKAYEENGTSKANRIRTFWKKESDEITATLVEALLKYTYNEKTNYDRELSAHDENLFIEARKIVQRLTDESNLKHEGLKKSLIAFLSDPRFPQQKRKIETIKDHFPTLGESELMQLLSQIGAIRYRGNDSELWGHSPASGHTKSVHIAGDYVVGDKVGRDKNTTPESSWLSKYWWGLIIPIVVIIIGFVITEGELPQSFGIELGTNTIEEQLVATSTVSLADILSKALTLETVVERQDFLEKYIGSTVVAQGTVSEVSRSGTSGFLVDIKVVGQTITCPQDASDENEKQLLLLKGKRVQFVGKFPFTEIWGHGLGIDECVFSRL